MPVKGLPRVELKDGDTGSFVAIFSTFNVVDKDNDLTLPGAFADGAKVPVSAYGHSSWEGKLPVGIAEIKQTQVEAQAHGQFFMDTDDGRNTHKAVKSLHGAGLGEWSYGYEPQEFHFGEHDGKSDVRFLTKVGVFEVSPVLQGAGVGVRTLSVKGAAGDSLRNFGAAIKAHETETTDEPWNVNDVTSSLPTIATIGTLRDIYAWVNAKGDPESRSSYRVPHHVKSGSANVRACLMGIASLNAGGSPVDSHDGPAVYAHLAGHLVDAGIVPPDYAPMAAGNLKLADEAALVLAGLASLRERAAEVLTLRAAQRKSLSGNTVRILEWISDELREYGSLLSTPTDEAAKEYLRYIATAGNQEEV